MKKRLEAELISIAHRILKLKNKSELIQLHQETQKLYEALSVLRFVEDNLEIIKPKIDVADLEEKLETAFDKKEEIATTEETTVAEPISEQINIDSEPKENFDSETILSNQDLDENDVLDEKEEVVEAAPLEEKEEIFTPAFELQKEEEVENELEIDTKPEPTQISFEDLLGHQYSEPIFEKVSDKKPEQEIVFEEKTEENLEEKEPKTVASEKVIAGINIGLNDRVGFVKQLFGDSNEDFNRVLSQLSTFDNFQEAKNFIEDMVKPDYNDWKGKEDFEERFMEVIAQKFN